MSKGYTTTVCDYLDNSTKKYPEKIVFSDEANQITYTAFREKALRIATFLADKGIYKQPILVFTEKGINCLISFFGVAYSGNFYTLVDSTMPYERIEKIVEILQPAQTVVTKNNLDSAKKLVPLDHIIVFEELLCMAINENTIANVRKKVIDTDLLYVLFTSGSTGVPKGVTISHRSVIDFTEWVSETFDIHEDCIFGNQVPFYFDMSVLDVYCAIKNGARTEIIPSEMFLFSKKLLDYMERKKINSIFWVPSAMIIVANTGIMEKLSAVPPLQKILFAGEVMPNKQLNIWRRNFPAALFANLYGPTEVTVICTYYVIDRAFSDDEPLPIGKACNNTGILVISDEGKLVGLEEHGELCVRGSGLSYGYYRDFNKTEENFRQNPINTAYPEKIYCTGDIVKYNKCGEIIYIGRKDFQIKHSGYRIELGEIETVVSSFEGVDSVACLYDYESQRILLYYTGSVDAEEIGKQTKDALPRYMLPKKYYHLKKIPININGKVDRSALKEML